MNTIPQLEISAAERMAAFISKYGLTAEWEFIPQSKSRNVLTKENKQPSLNWKAKIFRAGKLVMETDYMQGAGHLPKPHNNNLRSVDGHKNAILICEHRNRPGGFRVNVPDPLLSDLFYSLSNDAECGQYSFEDFCANYGYDSDSRKAHAIWQQCRDIWIALVQSLGSGALEELTEAARDY